MMVFGLSSENELLAVGQWQVANLTLGNGRVVVIECSAKYPVLHFEEVNYREAKKCIF